MTTRRTFIGGLIAAALAKYLPKRGIPQVVVDRREEWTGINGTFRLTRIRFKASGETEFETHYVFEQVSA